VIQIVRREGDCPKKVIVIFDFDLEGHWDI
jgi:hypothetical protein